LLGLLFHRRHYHPHAKEIALSHGLVLKVFQA